MRTMYDGIDSDAEVIPTNAQLVAGYVDGGYVWTAADWARFPHSVHVLIAVSSSTNAGSVLDCEKGDATPAESVTWVVARRRAGADPTVYCDTSTWPAVRAAFAAAKEAEPHYWVASYDGNTAIPAGAMAHQYESTARWDLSSVADYWPGVDPAPIPTPPAIVPASESEDDMQQIEPTSAHPGEYAYGVPSGKTKVAFVADGYSLAPAKLRVVTWVGNSPQVHDGVALGGSAKEHYAAVALPAGCNAVTVRREDASEFPVGVYLI
jgi:hypothetical protein